MWRNGNVRLHALVSGEGKVLILLHGWPGFWKDWERVVEPLSSSAMLVLQDLKGFGLFDRPESVEECAPSSCKTIGPTAEPSSGSRLTGRKVHRDACCLEKNWDSQSLLGFGSLSNKNNDELHEEITRQRRGS
ncbi:MAG: alpha/beta fold hydrolase [Candidatus Caldarchaeales archaeon]|jgi:hypothetical protein